MSEDSRHIIPDNRSSRRKRKSPARRIFGIVWKSLLSLVLLIIVLLTGITLYLTPRRLSEIVSREASRTLDADVRTGDIRFTLWSSFPHFCIETDFIHVRSRALDSISHSLRAELPDNPDSLLSAARFRGGIDIIALLKKEIRLRDVDIDSLSLNLVAASDSLTNYNIWPKSDSKLQIPYFTASRIRLTHPRHISYFSNVNKASADIELSSAGLLRSDTSLDTYTLTLGGKVDASVGKLRLLSNFPFDLSGKAALGFKPFGIRLSDYEVALGNTSGKMNLALNMGANSAISDFSYQLRDFDLLGLLRYFPPQAVPFLSGINAEITLNASARLTSPYLFSSSELPSLEVDFNVPDGFLNYTLNKSQKYSMEHIGVTGRLLFDGKNPAASRFVIPSCHLQGEGINLDIKASATDLLDNPAVTLSLSAASDIARSASAIPQLRRFGLHGNLHANAVSEFNLSDLTDFNPEKISLKGNVNLDDFAFSIPDSDIKGSGTGLLINLSDSLKTSAKTLNVSHAGLRMGIVGMQASAPIPSERNFTPKTLLYPLGKGIDISAARLAITDSLKQQSVNLKDIRLVASASRRRNPVIAENFKIPEAWISDSLSMARVGHSSEFIVASLPEKVRNLIGGWDPHLQIKVGGGNFLTPSFAAANSFRNLDLRLSADTLDLRHVNLRSDDTGLALSARIDGLRRFLLASKPMPLSMNLDLQLDTVQINQLARAYESGIGNSGSANPLAASANSDAITSSDTISLLIPRNLQAKISASAMQTRYMNLHLYDLSTDVDIRDGVAKVNNLHISSDFGNAALDFAFNTADLQRMSMEARVAVTDIELVNFFRNFHTLLLMMPQMSNLHGNLSAEAEARILLFPNMYVNIPSVWADIYLMGKGLAVHQDPFIRHITSMMLIRNSSDIHIDNMKVHASVHDNLLELYPFSFKFDRYSLSMGGLNNFNGDMYYHIGIDKSPVPFPFGINVVGNMSHPQIRFGGAAYKSQKGSAITTSVMEDHCMNIIHELKHFFAEFIHKAAEWQASHN